jgi:hypothetical protein
MNATPEQEIHRSNKPLYRIDNLEDLLTQIVGDPACRRSGCNGRGFYGLRHDLDGSVIILLCGCGSYGQTESTRLLKKVEAFISTLAGGIDKNHDHILKVLGTMENHRRLSEDLNYDHMKRIESVTVVGFFRRIKKLIKGSLTKSSDQKIYPAVNDTSFEDQE